MYTLYNNQFLTKTFLLRSKHQLSNNASILAKSASITGEAGTGERGDSTGDRDDDDDNPCSASVVLAIGVIVLVSTKYTKIYRKQDWLYIEHDPVVPKIPTSRR